MSPRAAWRLERFGFPVVYEYAVGKVDWMAAGWPTVRADASEQRALDVADRDPPTCAPSDQVRELRASMDRSVIVVNERRAVLGRVPAARRVDDGIAETVMEPAPATVRADEPLVPLLERMTKRNVREIIVSTPEGELLGVVYRDRP
jgi:CBS domain-containing protein